MLKLSRLFSVLFLVMLFAGCGTFGGKWWFLIPNNQSIATYGTVRVAAAASLYDPTLTWSADQMSTIRHALKTASHLGPEFVLVANEGQADVVIYRTEFNCARGEGGQFIPGTRFIEIDPICVSSSIDLETVVVHELGHYVGMKHICLLDAPEDTQTGCSPVGRGPAALNPELMRYGQVTELDIMEFRRAWALSHPNSVQP
jgi:hypothetical protein